MCTFWKLWTVQSKCEVTMEQFFAIFNATAAFVFFFHSDGNCWSISSTGYLHIFVFEEVFTNHYFCKYIIDSNCFSYLIVNRCLRKKIFPLNKTKSKAIYTNVSFSNQTLLLSVLEHLSRKTPQKKKKNK